VPKATAKRILAKAKADIAEGRFLDRLERIDVSFEEAARSFLTYSKNRRRSYRRDEGRVRTLLSFCRFRKLWPLDSGNSGRLI